MVSNSESRRLHALQQIAMIDEKINTYEAAKTAVSSARTKAQQNSEEVSRQAGMAEDKQEIRRADSFEGDMAARLQNSMETFISVMNQGKSEGSFLVKSLDSQIAKIENKLQDLHAERSSWSSLL